MSITAANVYTRARQITKRDNTALLSAANVQTMLLETLRELSGQMLLKSETSGTLTGSGTTITAPTDMLKGQAAIEEFYLDSKPMNEITFAEYLENEIDGYCLRNGTIYVRPTSDNDRTYTIYYYKYHAASVATIEFDDDFEVAIVFKMCQKIYEFFSQIAEAEDMDTKYKREVDKNTPEEMFFVRARKDNRG